MEYIIIAAVVIYGIVTLVVLHEECTEYTNFRIIKDVGLFGGNVVDFTKKKRKPTSIDLLKALLWLPRVVIWFILTTLSLILDALFMTNTKLYKWLDKYI